MTERFTNLDAPAWLALFEGVQRSWFRLETLQTYAVDCEADDFAHFLATGRVDERPNWRRMIASHKAAGRQLRRVNVVQEPLTEYLRYELAVYRLNAAAGEEIHIVPIPPRGTWPEWAPVGRDFWLFDDHDLWFMNNGDRGRFLLAERSRDADLVIDAKSDARQATRAAMPLTNFLSRGR